MAERVELPVRSTLSGVEIRVEKMLAGCKYAIQCGVGPIYVSPAMYDLLIHADADELERLLKAIHVRRIPAMPTLRELGSFMLTRP